MVFVYSCFSLLARAYTLVKQSLNAFTASYLSKAEIVYQTEERVVYKLRYTFNGNEYTHIWSKDIDNGSTATDNNGIAAAIFKCEDEMIDAYPVFKHIQGPLCPLEVTPMEILQFLIDKKYLRNSNYLDSDWIQYGNLVVYYTNLKKRVFSMTESLHLGGD